MFRFPNTFLMKCFWGSIFYIVLWLAASCVENPFADAGGIASRMRITGRVVDQRSGTPLHAYLWMDGVNFGGFTGKSGNFELILPPASQQPGGGITGAVQLFAYVGNYKAQSIKIVLRDGEFVYSQGVVDENGNIQTPIQLMPLLEIFTDVSPSVFDEKYSGPLAVVVKVHAIGDSVEVHTRQTDVDQIAGAIVNKIDSVSTPPRLLTAGAPIHSETHVVTKDTVVWKGKFDIPPGTFQKGEYVLVPYFWVPQPVIPRDLFESIGATIDTLTVSYSAIPFSRNGGKFFVVEPKGK